MEPNKANRENDRYSNNCQLSRDDDNISAHFSNESSEDEKSDKEGKNSTPQGEEKESIESDEEKDESIDVDVDDELSSEDDKGDGQSASNDDVTGLCEYERLRLERIKRNEARLATLGLSSISKPKKKAATARRKPNQTTDGTEIVKRQLPKRATRAQFHHLSGAKRGRSSMDVTPTNPDACCRCQKEGGDVICCSFCGKLYHPECHVPPISEPEAKTGSSSKQKEKDGDDLDNRRNDSGNSDQEGCGVDQSGDGKKDAADHGNVDQGGHGGFFRCSDCSDRKRRVACGKCGPCTRKNNCGTCVFCVDLPEFGGRGCLKRGKCLFRKCERIVGKRRVVHSLKNRDHDVDGASDKKKTPTEDVVAGDTDSTQQSEVCAVCKDGGDLICCDRCERAYHSVCHKPKIYSFLDDEEFLCMACNSAGRRKRPKLKHDYGLVADIGGRQMKVTVVGPVARCTVCSGTAVDGNGLKLCKVCDEYFHFKCHSPPLDKPPRGQWRCSKCKEAAKSAPKPKRYKSAAPLFEGENDDNCYICDNGGDLLCCDYCEKSFHMLCHIPPLLDVPVGRWKCCECTAMERTRLTRCGECTACLRPDCGKCNYCLDKPKFGGKNVLKQTCVHRECPNKRLAAPATVNVDSLTPAQKKKIEEAFRNASSSKAMPRRTSLGSNSKPVGGGKVKSRSKKSTNEGDLDKRESQETECDVGDSSVPVAKQSFETEGSTKVRLPEHFRGDSLCKKIQNIINGALKQPEITKVQDKACESLRKTITMRHDVPKIIELGGLRMLTQAMRGHPNKAVLQAEACCTIAEIIWRDSSASARVASEGCLDLVVQALENHRSHVKVQQMGCGVFRALSYDNDNFKFIENANGLRAVLLSMKRNPSKVDVIKEGCYFLQNILSNPSISSEVVVRDLEREAILAIVVGGMNANTNNLDFQESACGFLGNLAAVHEGMASVVGKFGSVIRLIVSTVRTDAPRDVVQAACSTLRVLAMGNEENQKMIADCGGFEAVLSVMESLSSNDEEFVQVMFRFLKELVAGSGTYSTAVSRGSGYDTILWTINSNLETASLVADGCAMLRRLKPGEAVSAVTAANTLVSAMRRHPKDNEIQIEGRQALLKLKLHFPAVLAVLARDDTQSLLNDSSLEATTSTSKDEAEAPISQIASSRIPEQIHNENNEQRPETQHEHAEGVRENGPVEDTNSLPGQVPNEKMESAVEDTCTQEADDLSGCDEEDITFLYLDSDFWEIQRKKLDGKFHATKKHLIMLGPWKLPNVVRNKFSEVAELTLSKMDKHDRYSIFAEPVLDNDKTPDYSEVVKDPMDFGTMRTKVKNGQYGSGSDAAAGFYEDFLLVFENCYLYNQEESDVAKEAIRLFALLPEAYVSACICVAKRSKETVKLQFH